MLELIIDVMSAHNFNYMTLLFKNMNIIVAFDFFCILLLQLSQANLSYVRSPLIFLLLFLLTATSDVSIPAFA